MRWIFCFLVLPLSLSALPLNNPKIASLTCDGVLFSGSCGPPVASCDTLSVRMGYYGDFIFNDFLRVDRSERGSIRLARLYTNGGELDFNIWNRIEFFGVLGVGNLFIQAPISNFSVQGDTVNSLLTIDTVSGFAWSVGLRGTAWQWGRFAFGIEGQYYGTTLPINFVADHFSTTPSYLDDATLKYRSWQLGVGTTYEVEINPCFSFLPYIGIATSGAYVDMDDRRVFLFDQNNTVELFNLKKERLFGYAFGGTLAGGERILISAEGRFAYEKALFISVQLRL